MTRYSIKAVFRKHKDGTIDALFPYEPELGYKIAGYSRLGQHFQADYDHIIAMTIPASPDEYKTLLDELTYRVGYDVTILRKVNRPQMIDLQRALNRTLTARA